MSIAIKNLCKLTIRYIARILSLPTRPSLMFLKLSCKKELIGVEVGVSMGANAKNILSRMPQVEKLYLVDPYKYADNLNEQHRVSGDYNENREFAIKNLNKFKDRIVFIYEPFSSMIISEKVDFVYIDGDHSTPAVISDIVESIKILKHNGMIAGHDIHFDSVRKGVEFVFGDSYNSFGIDWWVQF